MSVDVTTSVITLIEKSLAIYRTVNAGRNFGSDAAQSVMMLRFEAFRYQEWARDNKNITKLYQASMADTADQSTVALTGHVGAKQPISPAATACEALCDAVTQVIEVLQSVDELLNKYGRAFQSRKQPDDLVNKRVSSVAIGMGGLQGEMRNAQQKYNQLKESLQSKTSFGHRVKYGIQTWNDADKETLESLIKRFKYWNDSLRHIAPPLKPYLSELRLASQVVSMARSEAQLESVQSAAAESSYESVCRSATLKKKKIEGAMRDPRLKKSWADVKIDPKVATSRRFLTDYYAHDDEAPSSINVAPQRILVEWYFYDLKWSEKHINVANDRVESLALQFSTPEKPANLPVLDCTGWVQHPSKKDRALLYKVPQYLSRASQICKPMTLLELLTTRQPLTSKRLPSLADRFRLAAALATGFLELHTVDWIHKGFGSHNVLLFSDSEGKIRYDKPLISGFDFARPNREGEESLSVRPSKFDLYRHPDVRAVKPSADAVKLSSTRMHDVYSLGLVLFEIGMWTPLESYTKANLSPQDFSNRIQGYVERDLDLWMGSRFCSAVQSCLSGNYLLESEAFSLGEFEEVVDEQEGPAISGEDLTNIHQLGSFYRFIVAELHGCQCKLEES
ncbi:hypothetical protein BKA56DRAFT_606791 [Ilyonectria sp. MPI-CAGE-AT-0026]|nr:hypothetical protein BKA56DRAFT_606791 [Ilyonectria sp. MPI-CAGE-AT-0026]